MKSNKQKIVHHISRLEGQLASVKRELQKDEVDCKKTAQTLRAASRSFSSLRMSFVTCFLEMKFVKKDKNLEEDYKALLQVINS